MVNHRKGFKSMKSFCPVSEFKKFENFPRVSKFSKKLNGQVCIIIYTWMKCIIFIKILKSSSKNSNFLEFFQPSKFKCLLVEFFKILRWSDSADVSYGSLGSRAPKGTRPLVWFWTCYQHRWYLMSHINGETVNGWRAIKNYGSHHVGPEQILLS